MTGTFWSWLMAGERRNIERSALSSIRAEKSSSDFSTTSMALASLATSNSADA